MNHYNRLLLEPSSDCLHGEEQEPTEGGVSVLVVKHSAVVPQLHVHLISSNQRQNHSVAAAVGAVGRRAVVGRNLKELVLHQQGPHGVSVVAVGAEAEVVEAVHWCCEDSCKRGD